MKRINKILIHHSDEPKEKSYSRYASLIGACVCLFMTALNIINQTASFMALSTAVLFVAYIICFILLNNDKVNYKIAQVGCAVATCAIFTWYVVTGGEQGFSAIWLAVIPPVFLLCFGRPVGYIASTYFLMLLFICFWMPTREYFSDIYSSVFLTRFPVVYIAVFALAHVIYRELYTYEKEASKYNEELNEAILEERRRAENFSMEMAMMIVSAVDAKDVYTHQHSKRVALYTAEICKALGYSDDDCHKAFYIALVHDAGKIGVPDAVLTKAGKLTDEEYDKIKQHTAIGGKILRNITTFGGIEEGALYHHERYDGKGYFGLKGEHIPMIGRIVCVADCIDAMHSKRVYSEAKPMDYVAEELKRCSGTQFDPKIAEKAIMLIDDGVFDISDAILDYRIEQFNKNNKDSAFDIDSSQILSIGH